jgi:dimethylglycine dehydrogenase
MYYCYRPGEQHDTGRPVRTSSIHPRLEALGAQFQQVMGWERPRWFDPSGEGEAYAFGRSNWWEPVRQECLAVRHRVGLADISAFAKYEVRGRDAEAFLDRLIANRMPRRDGAIVLAHLLTETGRIESEMTITRLAPDHFYLLSAASAQLHDLDRLTNARAAGEDVTVVDVTEDFGCLVLAGPKAREVWLRSPPPTSPMARSPGLPHARSAPAASASYALSGSIMWASLAGSCIAPWRRCRASSMP